MRTATGRLVAVAWIVSAWCAQPGWSQEPGGSGDAVPADTTLADTPAPGPEIGIRSVPDSARVGQGVPLGRHDSHLNAYPYAYYTPETEFAIGAGGIYTFYTDRSAEARPSKIALSAYYSTKAQYKITLSPDLFFNDNTIFTETDLDFGRYVDRFYGVGSSTPDIDSTDYVLEGWGFRTEVQLPPFVQFISKTRAGFVYELKHRNITDTRGNPNLAEPAPLGIEGGLNHGLGWLWVWDSRDHVFYPQRGVYSRLSGTYYLGALGSDYDFNRYKADVRNYHRLGEAGVLALQFLGLWTPGNPPFYDLPALGGAQMLRGYYEGRYRDDLYLAAQMEYRRALFWRLGMVGFLGIGDVAPDLSGLRIRTSQVSGGAGLRVLFNEAEQVNLRIDLGIGKNTTGIYFGLEEAF